MCEIALSRLTKWGEKKVCFKCASNGLYKADGSLSPKLKCHFQVVKKYTSSF